MSIFSIGGDTIGIVKRPSGTVITKQGCSFQVQPVESPDRQVTPAVVELNLAWAFLPVDDDTTAITAADAIRYPMPDGADYEISGRPLVENDMRGRADHIWLVALTDIADQSIADLLQSPKARLITLIPAVGDVTEKPGGGKDYAAATPRDAQKFVLFNTGGFDGREESQRDQGLSRKLQLRLIGASDAVIEVGDAWEDAAATYHVESIDRTTFYKVEALVTAFLKVSGHSFG